MAVVAEDEECSQSLGAVVELKHMHQPIDQIVSPYPDGGGEGGTRGCDLVSSHSISAGTSGREQRHKA